MRLCIYFCSLLLMASVVATADEKLPADILQSKGLHKVGTRYLLEGESKLADLLRSVRASQHKVDVASTKRAQIEREIATAEDQLTKWQTQEDALAEQLNKTSKDATGSYNRIVNDLNAMHSKITQGTHAVAGRRRDLSAIQDPSDEFRDSVLKAAQWMETLTAQYDKLAADADVREALKKLNEPGKAKLALGPSQQLSDELPGIRKLAKSLETTVIKLQMEGGVPRVSAMLNGQTRVDMVVDSGAAIVSLSPATANRLGLMSTADDEQITLVVADGRTVKAHLKQLKTLKVGPFIVENVTCAIQPASVRDADDLLGGTFLRNFIYKMDINAGDLRLQQISGSPKAPDKNAPTTKPKSDVIPPIADVVPNAHATFPVAAGTHWVSSQFDVVAGKCYRITAPGKWTAASGIECGADGVCPKEALTPLGPQPYLTDIQRADWYVGQYPRSSLVARIEQQPVPFFVGSDQTFIAPLSGEIQFKMQEAQTPATKQGGKIEVTIAQVLPHWRDERGYTSIVARIDDHDLLHVCPEGLYWEWGGSWGKVGEHDGHYPTLINGICWWPKWIDGRRTELLRDLGLQPNSQVRIVSVQAKRGKVALALSPAEEVVFLFSENGLGSSQVGCVASFPSQ